VTTTTLAAIVLSEAPGFCVETDLRGFRVRCEGCAAEVYFEIGNPTSPQMRHERDCRNVGKGGIS